MALGVSRGESVSSTSSHSLKRIFYGTLLLLPFLFTSDLHWLAAPKGIAAVLYLGVVVTALSYWLFARGHGGHRFAARPGVRAESRCAE